MGRTSQRERPISAGPVEVRASPTEVGKADRQEQWSIWSWKRPHSPWGQPPSHIERPLLLRLSLPFGVKSERLQLLPELFASVRVESVAFAGEAKADLVRLQFQWLVARDC